jgi:putative peptide zinc metalloprotease protein
MDRVFTPQNLVAVWLLFPVLKIFHELGHGYATKAFGGEVHDMGVMFLVFTPVPYVDASSAWAFPSKARRALVGAGGMIAEVFLAALAFYVWLAAEPGLVRSLAYNALVIGGATTLLFNANPLLRFDGYYVLSDLIEIPNLRVRSNRYISYLAERYLFGRRETPPPETASGEPPWLVGYSISAFVYRTFIVVAILFWIFDRFLLAGIVLGGIAAVGWVGMPLFKGVRYLFSSPALRRRRGRAFALVGGAQRNRRVRRDGGGGARSSRRDRRSPHPPSRSGAECGGAPLPGAGPRARSPVPLACAGELEVRSRTSGTFVLPRSPDLPGRFVQKGEALAWVVDLETITVRAVVSQDGVDLVRQRATGGQVRLAERIAETYHAEVLRLVPGASEQLPSLALGSLGGGEVPTDPSAPGGDQAVQSLFEVELELPSERPLVNAGGRVYVRFDHGSEPLGLQWYRGIRQLFLSRLHV